MWWYLGGKFKEDMRKDYKKHPEEPSETWHWLDGTQIVKSFWAIVRGGVDGITPWMSEGQNIGSYGPETRVGFWLYRGNSQFLPRIRKP